MQANDIVPFEYVKSIYSKKSGEKNVYLFQTGLGIF